MEALVLDPDESVSGHLVGMGLEKGISDGGDGLVRDNQFEPVLLEAVHLSHFSAGGVGPRKRSELALALDHPAAMVIGSERTRACLEKGLFERFEGVRRNIDAETVHRLLEG